MEQAEHGERLPGELHPAPVSGRLGRMRILRPFRQRDFALLWCGMAVSLVGDGVFFVAMPWLVLGLGSAGALSAVGVAWTLPQVLLLLLGGVLSDRFPRRLLMIAGDVIRAAATGTIGVLAVTGAVELWHVVALVALYAVGQSLFTPAFGAIVPEIVPQDLLVEANSVDQFVRPVAFRLAGPALGGLLIALAGTGAAFLADASSFVVSAAAISLMRPPARPRGERLRLGAVVADLRAGYAYVRSQTWIWATLFASAASMLAFWGPWQVLVPLVVKEELGGSAGDLGLVFTVGGVGAILASLAMSQVGLPRRFMLVLYVTWAVATGGLAFFGLVSSVWQAMAVSFALNGAMTAGTVVWATLLHRLVPNELLGRVSALDWFVSTSLVPLSYLLTGLLANVLSPTAVLVGAGVAGGLAFLVFLPVRGVRSVEGRLGAAAAAAQPSGAR